MGGIGREVAWFCRVFALYLMFLAFMHSYTEGHLRLGQISYGRVPCTKLQNLATHAFWSKQTCRALCVPSEGESGLMTKPSFLTSTTNGLAFLSAMRHLPLPPMPRIPVICCQTIAYDNEPQGSRSQTLNLIRSQAMKHRELKKKNTSNRPHGQNKKKESYKPNDFPLGSLPTLNFARAASHLGKVVRNPFDATLLNLGPQSRRLILYCTLGHLHMLAYKLANTPGQDHQAYTMNRVALDFKDDCLSNSITNSALLHTILYTVCTDLDMKRTRITLQRQCG